MIIYYIHGGQMGLTSDIASLFLQENSGRKLVLPRRPLDALGKRMSSIYASLFVRWCDVLSQSLRYKTYLISSSQFLSRLC